VKENIIVTSERVSENRWNDALQSAGVDGTLFQSTYWAEYLRQVQGDQPIYLLSEDKKGNINGLLLAVQSCYGKFPVYNWGHFESARGSIIRKLYKTALEKVFEKMLPFIYWQNGPVIIRQFLPEGNSHEHEIIYRCLVEKILSIVNSRNIYAIKLARPSYFMDHPELMSFYGFEKRRMGTILLDLIQPIESIWRSIGRKNRSGIKKAEKVLTFSEVRSLAELKDFYRIYVQTIKRQKAKPYVFSHFESLWNFFSPLGKIHVFTAYFRGKPVAVHMCLAYNNLIHTIISGDSDFARAKKIPVNDAMCWHIIKWAHDRGFQYFDLSGSFLYKIDAGDGKALSLFKYKSKWGKNIEFNDYWKLTDQSAFNLRAKGAKMLNLFIPESYGCFSY